jgi:hypothetical protein
MARHEALKLLTSKKHSMQSIVFEADVRGAAGIGLKAETHSFKVEMTLVLQMAHTVFTFQQIYIIAASAWFETRLKEN